MQDFHAWWPRPERGTGRKNCYNASSTMSSEATKVRFYDRLATQPCIARKATATQPRIARIAADMQTREAREITGVLVHGDHRLPMS